MSANDLPPEILAKIFRQLPRACLQSCSTVCKQWGDVTDSFFYKEFSKKEYPDTYEDAYRKANLSWQELYNSLSLWPRIESAKMNCYHSRELDYEMDFFSLDERERRFFVLQNGVIAYPQFLQTEDFETEAYYRNSVVYYDSKTMRMIDRTYFEKDFDQYGENDDFIVFRDAESDLFIMSKANKKLFQIGEAKQYEFGDISKFEIVRNKVYFIDHNNKMWVSQLDEQDGEICVKTEALDVLNVDFQTSITAMCYVNENQANILTSCGDIYSIIDKKIKCEGHITKKNTDRFQIVANLKKYGFDWSQQAIYDWVHQRCALTMDLVQLSKIKDAVVYKHGHVVLIATSRRTIQVYYNPYRRDGALKLYNSKPILKVDLNDYYQVHRYQKYKKIEQIDVIEIVNGHRIVVIYSDKIVVLEFTHDETSSKRIAENTGQGLSKKSKQDSLSLLD